MATTKKAKKADATPKVGGAEGVVLPQALYTLRELGSRVGLGTWGLREARGAGLKVLRFHGRGWVRGADFIAFLEQQNGDGTRPKQSESAGQAAETDSQHEV